MSDDTLKLLTLALFALHAGVLVLGLMRRGRAAVLWLSGADAAAALAWLAFHPAALRPPVDWPVLGIAGLEGLVLVAVAMAVRGVRRAMAAVWAALVVHLVASGLALAFVLTFRITRLF